MGFSRIMARFPLAKRLTSYSLFIEAFSLIAVIGIFPASLVSHRH
jgi:hypothetical protein